MELSQNDNHAKHALIARTLLKKQRRHDITWHDLFVHLIYSGVQIVHGKKTSMISPRNNILGNAHEPGLRFIWFAALFMSCFGEPSIIYFLCSVNVWNQVKVMWLLPLSQDYFAPVNFSVFNILIRKLSKQQLEEIY